MSLEQKDIEVIEHLLFKFADDIAISISRSFERLEERIDASESRLHSRLAEVDEKVEASRQDISDIIGEMKEEVRDVMRLREM